MKRAFRTQEAAETLLALTVLFPSGVSLDEFFDVNRDAVVDGQRGAHHHIIASGIRTSRHHRWRVDAAEQLLFMEREADLGVKVVFSDPAAVAQNL